MSTSRFLAGAAVGLVIGLLIAPEKGSDLRNEIVDTADQWKNKLNRLAGKANANLDELRAMLNRNIDGLSDDVKHRILTIIDEATEMSYSSKSHVGNGVV